MSGELENLEKSRRDLVANVSHELKTPITAIRAHLENLLDGVEQPEPATIEVMLAQVERLGRLVDQLLDLSRLESGEIPLRIEELPLHPLVDDLISEIDVALSGRGVRVDNRRPRRPAGAVRRPGARPSGAVQPRRQRGSVHPGGWARDGLRPAPERLGGGGGHRHRGRHPAGAPAAALRALLPRRSRARPRGRGHRDRARDRALGRGGARRPDQGGERTRPRERLHLRPARRPSGSGP